MNLIRLIRKIPVPFMLDVVDIKINGRPENDAPARWGVNAIVR
jgi:hypothetical protein